jgi:hypothetical protein
MIEALYTRVSAITQADALHDYSPSPEHSSSECHPLTVPARAGIGSNHRQSAGSEKRAIANGLPTLAIAFEHALQPLGPAVMLQNGKATLIAEMATA